MVSWQSIDSRINPFYRELETLGLPLDPQELQTLAYQRQQELNKIKQELAKSLGFIPNPNKPEDWQRAADKYGVTLPTNSRGPKTDEWTVKKYRDQIPEMLSLQEARRLTLRISQIKKLQQTAASRFKAEGKHTVHPTYHHDEELGRVHSGGEANPMNWTDDIRKTVKLPGYYIVEADYKALELKVLRKLSGDPQLTTDLKGDIHSEVAKAIFSTSNPTDEQRQVAKVVTYATMFGGSEGTVAGPINEARKQEAEKQKKTYYRKMTYEEAGRLQEAWRRKYPKAAAYLDKLGAAASFAISYHGRQKALPNVSSQDLDEMEQQLAAKKRLAINSPIQNTGGDLAKLGFASVFEDPRVYALGIRFITTRHDSIVLAVPMQVEKDVVSRILREDLESADTEFDLEVEIKVGDSWGTTQKLTNPKVI
jgi:DNA polymerase I-like protein with 3'-5' exonuclease and polymerase domains